MAVKVHPRDAEGAGKALTDAVIAHVQLMQETDPNWRNESPPYNNIWI